MQADERNRAGGRLPADDEVLDAADRPRLSPQLTMGGGERDGCARGRLGKTRSRHWSCGQGCSGQVRCGQDRRGQRRRGRPCSGSRGGRRGTGTGRAPAVRLPVVVRLEPGDEVLDRHGDEPVLPPEGEQRIETHHRAVVVDELGDDGDRLQAGEPGEFDARLGVAGSLAHPAVLRDEREDVPGSGERLRARPGLGEHADGLRAVGGADAGARVFDRVAGHGVGGALGILVDRGHRRQLEGARPCRSHRGADHA